jgi:aminoglycoside 2''-phosphotransferase
LIHGDLAPEHILCNPEAGSITGVIDWGDACLGDPALDFAGLFSLGGEKLVDRVLAYYPRPLDETFRRRVRFYHTIAPAYEIRYALTCDDRLRLQRSVETLSERLRV